MSLLKYIIDEKALTKLIGNLLDNKLNPVLKTIEDLKSKIDNIDKIEEPLNFLSGKYNEPISNTSNVNNIIRELNEEGNNQRKSTQVGK